MLSYAMPTQDPIPWSVSTFLFHFELHPFPSHPYSPFIIFTTIAKPNQTNNNNNLLMNKDPHISLPFNKRILLLPPKNLQMIHNRTLPTTIIHPKLRLFTWSQMFFCAFMRNKNLIILLPISIRPLRRVNNPIITMIPFTLTTISRYFLLTTEWRFRMVGMEVHGGSSVCETDFCSEWDFGSWFAGRLGMSFFDDP